MIDLEQIVDPLITWYQENKRDLPWRNTSDSYKIWISEIMLQQTRVEAVKEYYIRFIKEVPNIETLATIKEDKLLKLWQGLGYYSRAKNLQKCAKKLIENNQTELPRTFEELKTLPGIGPYAAGAISSIAYNCKNPAIDGNVLRVMARLHEDGREMNNQKTRNDYFEKLSKIMPDNTRDFTESLMELGALICLPNGLPKCEMCPIKKHCQSYNHNHVLEFPKKKKEIKRRIEEKTVLIFEFHNKFAIRKRKETGLLASLYEFYNLETKYNPDQIKEYLKKKNILYKEMIPLKEAKHIFSHLEWHMIGYLIKCEQKPPIKLKWVTKQEFKEEYSLPNAFSYFTKYIQK